MKGTQNATKQMVANEVDETLTEIVAALGLSCQLLDFVGEGESARHVREGIVHLVLAAAKLEVH